MSRLAALAAILLVAGLALASSTTKSGLFNNLVDHDAAIAAHKAAWKQLVSEPVQKSTLMEAMQKAGATCTRFSDRSSQEANPRKAFSCEKSVPSRFPLGFGASYYWVVVFRPSPQGFTTTLTKREQVGF